MDKFIAWLDKYAHPIVLVSSAAIGTLIYTFIVF